MPTDEQLRDALHRTAGTLPDDVGEWYELRARGAHRRRRRATNAGVALMTAGALVVSLVIFTGNSHDDRSVVATPSASNEIAAVVGGRLVVLSADDGHVVRTLTDGAGGSLTLTPDGATAYFVRGECSPDAKPALWRVPSAGGSAEHVAEGDAPQVSPDGRYLAYAGISPQSSVCLRDRIIVRDLLSGDELTMSFGGRGGVHPIAWSRDSQRLIVSEDEPGQTALEIAVAADGLRQLRRLTTPDGNGYFFMPSGEPVTGYPTATSTRIATFDQVTGEERATVTEFPTQMFLVGVGGSGRSFLLEGPLAESNTGWDLYRARVGDPEPVKLASHVRGVAWLPTTGRPTGEIVAKVVDGGEPKLVVLSAADGRVVRTLLTGAAAEQWSGLAVPADGRSIYLGGTLRNDRCESLPRVARMPRDGGPVEQIVGLSSSPVVSADGRWLGYKIGATCGMPTGSLGLTDSETGRNYRPYDGTDQAATAPLAIAPDGSKIVFVGAGELFIEQLLPPDVAAQPLAVPGDVESAAFLPDGRLVVAYIADSAHQVAIVDDAGSIIEPLLESGTEGGVHLSIDAAGRLLLVFDNGVVQVFTPGDPSPVTVVPDVTDLNVQSATWLPAAAQSDPTVPSTAAAALVDP